MKEECNQSFFLRLKAAVFKKILNFAILLEMTENES
jgi:hypothetical protein